LPYLLLKFIIKHLLYLLQVQIVIFKQLLAQLIIKRLHLIVKVILLIIGLIIWLLVQLIFIIDFLIVILYYQVIIKLNSLEHYLITIKVINQNHLSMLINFKI